MIGVSLRESELPEGVSDAVQGLAEFHQNDRPCFDGVLAGERQSGFTNAGDVR